MTRYGRTTGSGRFLLILGNIGFVLHVTGIGSGRSGLLLFDKLDIGLRSCNVIGTAKNV